MRISGSAVNMSGSTNLFQKSSKNESIRFWDTNGKSNSKVDSIVSSIVDNIKKDQLKISNEARKLLRQATKSSTKDVNNQSSILNLSDEDKQKVLLIERLLEELTGKKVKLIIPENIIIRDPSVIDLKRQNIEELTVSQTQNKGWGLQYDYNNEYFESESMNFSSDGTIKTSDGKEIKFSIDLNMSREFLSKQELHIRAGDAAKVDPLVINFDGNGVNLSDKKFSFDIDSDGQSEQISSLTSGNGFLAIDLNNDGKVNDGSELFGPKTNDGFSELSEYDSDKNNWIDENDPIFEKLRIWTKDENGNDVLFALGQKGIGAIYLGNVDTSFNIKNSANDLQGTVTQTGIYIKEDGKAGIVQHVDLSL